MRQPCSQANLLRGPSRGLATLAIVLGLLLLAAGVAASSQRALRAEEEAVSSLVHGARAFEAAQAGLDFALAALNAGALDANCSRLEATRESGAERRWAAQLLVGPVHALCVRGSQGWLCRCDTATGDTTALPLRLASELSAQLEGRDRRAAAFLVRAQVETASAQVSLQSLGCSATGSTCVPGLSTTAAPASVLQLSQRLAAVPGVAWPGELAETGAALGPKALFARVPGSWRDF